MAKDAGAITRRTLIGTAAAAGAAAAVPSASEAARRRPRGRRVDVAIVGAGLAGLTAARALARRGRSVAVLEASAEVGGRTRTVPIGGGEVVDVGGQWIGPTQDRIRGLARSLGVREFLTYNTGRNVYLYKGRREEYSGAIPPLSGPVLSDVATALGTINTLAQEVPRDAPWTAARAKEWDHQTVESWKQATMKTDEGKFVFDLGFKAVWAAEPGDVSLLHALFYVTAAGNARTPGSFDRLINVEGGAQERRFAGGAQQVSTRMARALGRSVRLGAPVRVIEQTGRSARVVADGVTVQARRVIVAIPPAMTAAIRFSPDLPSMRAQLVQRFPQASAIKFEAVYDRPFWRDAGLTGQFTADNGPVGVTFDNSPQDGRPGVMLGFLEGDDARVWSQRPNRVRRAAVLKQFVAAYGASAARPKMVIQQNWANDPHIRGCYEGYLPPGALSSYGPWIRKPVGRVHWAGTETSTLWAGYMDGAVRSGERAAAEVLRGL
ncbi:MAG: FAD-dependent oxidoreductase [Solirubrobacteraceae bacterium]